MERDRETERQGECMLLAPAIIHHDWGLQIVTLTHVHEYKG